MKTNATLLSDLFKKALKHDGLVNLTAEETSFLVKAYTPFKNIPDLLPGGRNTHTLAIPTSLKRAAIESAGTGESVAPVFALEDLFPNLTALGVTLLKTNKQVHKLPVPSGVGADWLDTTEDGSEGSDSIGSITFNPLRISHARSYSSLLLGQADPGQILLIIENHIRALEQKMLATILGVAARSSKAIQGIGYKITTGTDTKANAVVPTYATLLGLENDIFEAEVPTDRLAYVTNMAGRNILKQKKVEEGDGALYLMDGEGRVNGWPCLVLNAASKIAGADAAGNLLVFGNWSDLVITQFGDFTVIVDPLTYARQNKTMIHVNGFFDVKGARGTAVTSSDESTDVDEYANSFSSVAIKAS